MLRTLMKSKIHRAIVTEACLHYEGSITIDRTLMESANLIPFEQVHIYNVANGQRFSTYVIEGDADSGTICLNGAAARCVAVGDPIIIASYAAMNEEEARSYRPTVVLVDEKNQIMRAMQAKPSH
ncbi:MAG: aspartate 1-decarboxylase [Candidatus Tectomicrobia bacterium]|nr:aspartate 1-decarboxylase [Candidatus Tectomicrobia bacterium]